MTTFYDSRFTHRFPVPLLTFEWLHTQQPEEEMSDEQLLRWYAEACRQCCGVQNPTIDDAAYLIQRVVAASKLNEKNQGSESKYKRKDFGAALSDYLKTLELEDLILLACGYDYERARHVYCELDRDEATHLIDNFVKELSHRHNIALEVAIYGAGGGYKGNDAETEVIDLTTQTDVDLDKLNYLFNA